MSKANAPEGADTGLDNEVLDYERERDEETGSWTRASPRNAVIEQVTAYGFKVYLWGGENTHFCVVGRHNGEYIGHCRTLVEGTTEPCKGFLYNDGPCAHLCTLRKAAFVGDIQIEEANPPGTEHLPKGGRERIELAADEQEFGRPEDGL